MISVILCGGAGSRLWPLSREQYPKPFLRLPDGQSFLYKAFTYGSVPPAVEEIITVTNKDLRFLAAAEYRQGAFTAKASYILEPFGRNTAPAIAAAALEAAARYGPETAMLTLAADHIINNQAAFARAVEEALALAAQGRLVTFGIKPDRPETGYGYIRADGNRVLEFVEKPDLETARKYLDSGDYYWNSGLFCFTAGLILAELEKHAPELLTSVKACLAASSFGSIDSFDQGVVELDAAAFQDVPSISIDYAVMEKSDHLAVVPCDIGWNDIGSWGALCGLNACDTNGNRVASEGRIMLHDVENCDIRSHDRLVAALGVEDLLIIDTPDALLVAAKDRAQDVKLLYNNLKDADHETYRHHRTVFRPWGSYTVLESGPRFKIKRLEVKPGSSISMQRHYHRSEHWIVVSGMAEVVCDDETFMVGVDESTYIKAGRKHRVSNRGLIDLVMIEVQSGDYLGEDDIVRLQDEYGRFNP